MTVSENAVFTDSYMVNAWSIFMQVVEWMKNTTILTISGVNFTFLGVAVSLLAMGIVLHFIDRIFWGD